MTKQDLFSSLKFGAGMGFLAGLALLLLLYNELPEPGLRDDGWDCQPTERIAAVLNTGYGWNDVVQACPSALLNQTWRAASDDERAHAIEKRRENSISEIWGQGALVGGMVGVMACLGWLGVVAVFRSGRWAKRQVETYAGTRSEKQVVLVDGRSINIAVSEHLHVGHTGPPRARAVEPLTVTAQPSTRPRDESTRSRPCPGCARENPIVADVCECGLVLRVPPHDRARLPSGPQKCSACGLINPQSAQRCDCGKAF